MAVVDTTWETGKIMGQKKCVVYCLLGQKIPYLAHLAASWAAIMMTFNPGGVPVGQICLWRETTKNIPGVISLKWSYLASWFVMMEWDASSRLCWSRPGFLWWPPRHRHGSSLLSEYNTTGNQNLRALQRWAVDMKEKNSKMNGLWREAHLGFDTAEQSQLLFLLLKLSPFPVLLQHLLLLLQTFSDGKEECTHYIETSTR